MCVERFQTNLILRGNCSITNLHDLFKNDLTISQIRDIDPASWLLVLCLFLEWYLLGVK